MIKNYFLSAIRSLKKKIGFTIVNIIGLAFGMATCLIIFLFVQYDLSYDDFQDEQVYRIWLNRVYPEREVDYAHIPHSISPQMVEDFPEVKAQTRLFIPNGTVNITVGDDSYNEENLLFADSTLFDVLKFPLVEGDPNTALKGRNSIILSETTAKKLFGDQSAIGKTIEFQSESRVVTAVAKDYPENSHLAFNYISLITAFPFFRQPNWLGFSAYAYIKINKDASPGSIEEKIPQMLKQYADGHMRARSGISFDEYIEAGNGYNYHLMPISDIHLHSNIEAEIKANGNITYVYIFSIVAIFILIIACINFMNLSTARSTERSKEVGIRKVMGSTKEQLIGQFLTESIVVVLISAIIAIILTYISLPFFNDIADRPLSISQLFTPVGIISGLLVIFFIGIVSGAYPAFIISSYRPVSVLKGKLIGKKSGTTLRNVLVVLQFAISIALISVTLLVYNQMSFLLNKPLGFDEENVIAIENAFAINNIQNGFNWDRFETFKNELEKLDGVKSATYTSALPGDVLPGYIVKVPQSTEKESMVTRSVAFGDNMAEVMNMRLLEGRFFSPDFNDSLNMILNQSAISELGIDNPIGKKIINVNDGDAPDIEYTIIGVIEDFHFQSLHIDMEPIAILSMESRSGFINKAVLKVNSKNVENTLSSIEDKWAEFAPAVPFQSYFLDSNLEEFYTAEKATGRIFSIFTFLAIVIASIGLLGLSAFIINQRVKEIGVRKVLGASVPSLLILLAKDYIKLIVIGALIAVPLAYLWMENWLDGFAYATEINWLAFVLASCIALLIGLLTISIQSIKAAVTNPVNSLRDE